MITSAWKSSPVWSFIKIWQDQDQDGPHRLKNLEKLDQTDINQFSVVFISFLQLKDWSQPVSVSTGWGLVEDQSQRS